ncbi:hypothetical protein QYF61_025331 [Mycteria americana]|uniref:Uncharacterized protein n=1 Tax=Mycteria americana TaxID=33587 RepID=A0AAN7S144_MYCAM|nr:hypothetical protein QYF61_025331 [Mycteria americana]
MCPEEGTKAGEGLEGMSSEERLRTWGLSSLERRRPRGDLTALYSFLRRGRGEGVPGPVGMAQSCVRQERFRLDMRKHFFTERVVKAWNRLPGEVVDAPGLSVLKRHLDNALNTMLELLVSPEVGPGGAHRPQWLGPASHGTPIPPVSCQGPRGRVSAQPGAFSPCLSDGVAMHGKRSGACPALVLHAGRAGEWQLLTGQQAWSPSKQRLFCTSKNPWGNGAKGRAELAPTPNLQWAREPERARARVVPWSCKSSRREGSRKGPEEP